MRIKEVGADTEVVPMITRLAQTETTVIPALLRDRRLDRRDGKSGGGGNEESEFAHWFLHEYSPEQRA
jgi:hypothetical protein